MASAVRPSCDSQEVVDVGCVHGRIVGPITDANEIAFVNPVQAVDDICYGHTVEHAGRRFACVWFPCNRELIRDDQLRFVAITQDVSTVTLVTSPSAVGQREEKSFEIEL